MNAPDVALLIQRLFGDDEFRRRFLAAPQAVLDGLDLGRAERQAVLRLHGRLAATGAAAASVEREPPTWP
jgi:hypothetical protein